ncbi:hypothetical protein [Rhodopila sp.]|jgi:hypothetical protein|uniref:hypothetical protein n=1 Tax=Rhodopila sp. TaxID=2480087 RepID=UPI002BBBF712|nr:hypothetical protein [Rhodopila sp.]HVZ07562.1 hypothetical protein [Rhodopila sp.]
MTGGGDAKPASAHFGRYLRTLVLTAAATFAAVWLWVLLAPMAYMDPEYPSWRAKQALLDRCDLGDILILGDSRAAANILPTRLPVKATNLAVGGGEPIEAYAALTRALACKTPPKQVILSFDPGHFARPDLFWERSVRFGFLDGADIATLRADSLRTGDLSVYAGHGTAVLPLRLRDVLEAARFPSFHFAALTHSLGVLRWSRNERTFRKTLAARGQYAFGTEPGSAAVAVEGHLAAFRPLPVLDLYFDRLLSRLQAQRIQVRFLIMPVNQETWASTDPAVRSAFKTYLAGYAGRYDTFRVATGLPEHWPDRFFGDQFCHLNPDGAETFSALLARRLREPAGVRQEALSGWSGDTGPGGGDAGKGIPPSATHGS